MRCGKAEPVEEVPCGNTLALVGIDRFIKFQATISDHEDAHPIRMMKYSISPIVRVTVEPKKVHDLPRLVEGFIRLGKSDPLADCSLSEAGEYVISGNSDIHLERCVNNL